MLCHDTTTVGAEPASAEGKEDVLSLARAYTCAVFLVLLLSTRADLLLVLTSYVLIGLIVPVI